MENKQIRHIQQILGIIHIQISDELANSLLQFIKFSVVGLSNTIISYLINIITLFLMRPLIVNWDFIVGNIVAFLLSVLWSFYWNNRFVFKKQEGETRSILSVLLRAYVSYGFTGIILNNLLSLLWIHIMGISKYISPLMNLIISVPLNFVINKFWTFKTK